MGYPVQHPVFPVIPISYWLTLIAWYVAQDQPLSVEEGQHLAFNLNLFAFSSACRYAISCSITPSPAQNMRVVIAGADADLFAIHVVIGIVGVAA